MAPSNTSILLLAYLFAVESFLFAHAAVVESNARIPNQIRHAHHADAAAAHLSSSVPTSTETSNTYQPSAAHLDPTKLSTVRLVPGTPYMTGRNSPHNTASQGSNPSPLEPTLRSSTGTCSCPSQSYKQAVSTAFAAVQCVVVSTKVVSGQNTFLQLVEYEMQIQSAYSGPAWFKQKKTFKFQAYSNLDLCGLNLVRFNLYVMLLRDPAQNSFAGNTNSQNIFFVDQCSRVYLWKSLATWQKNFLRNL